jgi:hypothetical protein
MSCQNGSVRNTPANSGSVASSVAVTGSVINNDADARGDGTSAVAFTGNGASSALFTGSVVVSCIKVSPIPRVVSIIATDQDSIQVTFDKIVTGSGLDGISWVGLDTGPAYTSPAGELTIGYIVQGGQLLYNDSVVTWQYDAGAGDIVSTQYGEPLASTGQIPVDVSGLPAPSTVDAWATESSGVWQTESGDTWILESNP